MFDEIKSVHLIGAGGIGISAIGKWFLARGVAVSGSDTTPSAIVDDLIRRGVSIAIGHDAKNIPAECDLIVYTEAADEENVERAEAKRRDIRQLGHFDFLSELSKAYRTICITGTNGKSTTTAMTGRIFEDAGLDPTVFVGSMVPGWELGNIRIGKSDILIIEGDEYKQKMVKLSPEMTVITNIEADHLDVYRNLDHIVATFQELVDKTSGKVFVNAQDKNSQRLIGENIELFAVSIIEGMSIGIPGAFNRWNAAGAAAVARAFGIPEETIASALASFTGIWRRFERVGVYNGAEIISDYGHHPTAIKATLEAAREFFPSRRIVLCFQPHQHNRTKELFDEFATSFVGADVLVLAEIYNVTGRNEDRNISSKNLLTAIEHPTDKSYATNTADAERQLRSIIKEDDVVIVMGAGDIDAVARNLVK